LETVSDIPIGLAMAPEDYSVMRVVHRDSSTCRGIVGQSFQRRSNM
jgi:hypothetical protein